MKLDARLALGAVALTTIALACSSSSSSGGGYDAGTDSGSGSGSGSGSASGSGSGSSSGTGTGTGTGSGTGSSSGSGTGSSSGSGTGSSSGSGSGSASGSGSGSSSGSGSGSGSGSASGSGSGSSSGSGSGSSPAFPDNAVAIWDFEDALSSTTAADSSGNNHTATLNGGAAITAAGANGQGLAIENVSPNIAFADVTGGPIFDNTKDFTIAFWIDAAPGAGAYSDILSLDGANVSVTAFSLAPPPMQGLCVDFFYPQTDVGSPSTYYQTYSTAALGLGGTTFYNIVGVYTASTGTLAMYENGTLQTNTGDTAAAPGNPPVKAVGDFIIGAGKYNGMRTQGANAVFDGVRVYDFALTAPQVGILYNLNGD